MVWMNTPAGPFRAAFQVAICLFFCHAASIAAGELCSSLRVKIGRVLSTYLYRSYCGRSCRKRGAQVWRARADEPPKKLSMSAKQREGVAEAMKKWRDSELLMYAIKQFLT